MGPSKRQAPGCRYALFLIAAGAAAMQFADAQPETPDAAWMARAIEAKCTARQYAFDAVIELMRKRGEESWDAIATFKVKVAVAPEGKLLLWVSEKDKLAYLVASDGQNTWVFMPELNRYVRLDAGDAGIPPAPDEIFPNGIEDGDRDPLLCSKLVMAILQRVTRKAALTEMTRLAAANTGGEERQLPVLTVMSEKDERPGQNLTEVVIDPETLDIARMDWTRSASAGEEQRFVSLRVKFDKLQTGEPLPASYFVFSPPGDAQLVNELPAPGLDGSPFLDRAAPDFELQASGGSKVRLADLKGRFVVLAFAGDGCAACRRQLADLASIQTKYRDKRIAILAIATDQKRIAAGAPDAVPILDDTGAKVHRSYRVELAPTLVMVDPSGKVVRYLPGARNAAALEAVLNSVLLP